MARIELSNIGGGGSTLSLTTTGTSGASTLAGSVLNIPVYQGQLTLTTTGTSGAATLSGDILNIPNYATGGNPAGSAGQVQFNSTPAGSFAASANLAWDNAAVQLNINAPASPTGKLNVKGSGATSSTVNTRLTDSGNTELLKVLDNGSTNIGSNFNWDNVNGRLGLGTSTPNQTLEVSGAMRLTGTAGTAAFMLGRNSAGDVSTVTLSTTGTSGAATLSANVLNIPQYSTAPAGSTGEIQYNNAGAFAASANLAWDNSGSGRLNIGSAITTSARLGVRGASDLASSFSLICSNNSGTEYLRVRNDGVIQARGNYINLGTDQNVGIGPTTNGGGFSSSGGDVVFAGSNGGVNNACAAFNIVGGRKLANSGVLWLNGGTFDPTSSSNTYSIIDISPSVTINQTGTASGITRGLYIRPTLTSAADYRGIEWNNSTGYGLYGTGTANNYLAGNTAIGTTTPSARLHVRGSNTSSGTNALLVQNSTPSDIYKIENDGKISYWATNTAAGTTGPQTIDKPSGTVNFGIGAGSLVVTNSLCTTNSLVFATVRTNDATAYIKNVVPAAGSFTINLGAAATAETSVGFFIIN